MTFKAKITNVCLITNEIYPFAPGGIGRLVSNWIIQNKDIGSVNLNLLFPEKLKAHSSEISEYCKNYDVNVYFCEQECEQNTEFGNFLTQISHDSWDYTQAYYVGYSYFCKLKDLESQGIVFDIVEFPDYGGWAAISIEAKRSGITFDNTIIAVRLHSTFGIIVKHEEFYHQPSIWHAGVVDLERFSLEHADVVVGHIREIAQENMEFYHFHDDWLERVIIETPPILIDDKTNYEDSIGHHSGTRFIFSSRFQPFKRPDLFIKASCLYYRNGNEGESLLISYGWDKSYVAWLESLIPSELKEKIRVLTNLTVDERRRMLIGATIVIPSDYESYCLFAYESALQGNRVLLRRSCSAFGRHKAWIDGENCLLFGDAPEDLALVMERSVEWRPATTLVTKHDLPYWNNYRNQLKRGNEKKAVSLHLVICDVEDNYTLERCTQILHEQSFDAATVVCTSRFSERASIIERIFPNVSVVKLAYGSMQMDEVYDIAKKVLEDAVVVLFASDMSNRFFCQSVKDIFVKNSSIGVITCHDINIDDQGIKSIQFTAGEQASCVLSGMSVVGRLIAVRRSVILQQYYDYASRSYGWQSFFQMIHRSGVQISVIPDALNYTNFYNNPKNFNISFPTQMNRILNSSKSFVSSYGMLLDRAEVINSYRKIVVRDVSIDTPIVRVNPKIPEWWGDQVSFNTEEKSWLIHPMDDQTVIARLHIDRELVAADAFFVDIKNIGENSGVLISLIGRGPGLPLKNSIEEINEESNFFQSVLVPAKEIRRIICPGDSLRSISDLYIVSKVPLQYSSNNCWAMLTKYGGLYL